MDKVFEIQSFDNYLLIKLKGSCDFSNIKGFYDEVMNLLQYSRPHVVIDCEDLLSISKDWVRELLRLHLFLKSNERMLRFIQASPALKASFKTLGVDDAFKTRGSLKEALIDFGLAAKLTLDTEFINPFLDSTINVLKVQAGVEANAGKIYLKKTNEPLLGDVSGVIGIVSENFTGAVVISFPEKTFLKVMSGMLGEEYLELNQDILDGAGEITNIIFGQAKVILNEKGYGIKTALPSVVHGKDHSVNSRDTSGQSIVVPFSSNSGNFFVEICLSA